MRIINLRSDDSSTVRKVAALWVKHATDATAPISMEDALAWVEEGHAKNCISRVAVDERGEVIGWYCSAVERIGKLWERERAIVDVNNGESKGVWEAFEIDFEEQVKARGGATMQSLHAINGVHKHTEHETPAEVIEHLAKFINCMKRINSR